MGIIEDFIRIVSEKSEFQKKYLNEWYQNNTVKKELEILLEFYQRQYGYSLDFLAESYDFINHMVMEEAYYFAEKGTYRNSSFKQVNEFVYQNEVYMTKYMCGLTISDYIWSQHIEMLHYFEKYIEKVTGRRYLEIGPGFGQFFLRAIQKKRFEKYLAVDLSATSVQGCKDFISYCHGRNVAFEKGGIVSANSGGEYSVLQKDFYEFESDESFDCIVMGEVLEHVEEPLKMMKKIYSILSKEGTAFITTVINSPAFDHIYLFPTIESVLDMARKAGFNVEDYMCAVAGKVSLEKAIKKRRAITIAMVVKKIENGNMT